MYSRAFIYYNDYRDSLEKFVYDLFKLELGDDDSIHSNTLADYIKYNKINLNTFCVTNKVTYDDALHLLLYLSDKIKCDKNICDKNFIDKITVCLYDNCLSALGTDDEKVYWDYITDSLKLWFEGEENVSINFEYDYSEMFNDNQKMLKLYCSKSFKEDEYELFVSNGKYFIKFNNDDLYEKVKRFFYVNILKSI